MNGKALRAALVIAALAAAACGVDEEPMRPRGGAGLPSQAGPDLASMTVEERNAEVSQWDEKAVTMVRWPDGQPGERDALADVRTCREKLLADEGYVRAHPLHQFALAGECMEDMGWVFDPELATAGS